jgi:hypothetical protein
MQNAIYPVRRARQLPAWIDGYYPSEGNAAYLCGQPRQIDAPFLATARPSASRVLDETLPTCFQTAPTGLTRRASQAYPLPVDIKRRRRYYESIEHDSFLRTLLHIHTW